MTVSQKFFQMTVLTAAVLLLMYVAADVSKDLSLRAAVLQESGSVNGANPVSPFSRSGSPQYIHRGDWEPPDVLVVVENEEWQTSLDIIVGASASEDIPAYILTDHYDYGKRHQQENHGNHHRGRPLLFSYNTPWIRDYGPVQLKSADDAVRWLDFGYAEDRPLDDSVPQQLAEYLKLPIQRGDYYLEGGSVISNGRGLCAMTDASVEKALVDLDDPEEIMLFSNALGCASLAILPALTGESTGHADIIAQFISPEIVAVSSVHPDSDHEVSVELDRAAESLLSAAHFLRQRLQVIRLPMHVDGPDFYSYVNGTRLKKSYLIPSFENVPGFVEEEAYKTVRSVLQGTRLVPVPADTMVRSGGAVHCITLGLSIPRSWPARFLIQADREKGFYDLFSFMRKIFQREFEYLNK